MKRRESNRRSKVTDRNPSVGRSRKSVHVVFSAKINCFRSTPQALPAEANKKVPRPLIHSQQFTTAPSRRLQPTSATVRSWSTAQLHGREPKDNESTRLTEGRKETWGKERGRKSHKGPVRGQLLVNMDSGVGALRARATLLQLAYQIAASSMMKRERPGGLCSPTGRGRVGAARAVCFEHGSRWKRGLQGCAVAVFGRADGAEWAIGSW